jgi:tetratricopeptide (TPR) repeat protein
MVIGARLALAVCFGAIPCARAACNGPQTLEAKLRAHPAADTYSALGEWFGDHHQFACAVVAFRAALKLEPGSARLSYLLGLTLYSSGDAKDALSPLEQSVQLLPEALKPHLILAAALNQLERHEEAEAAWRAALKIDPHSTIALDGLSKSLIADGDYGAAINLLRSTPYDPDLALDLALAYGKSGMLDQATEVLTQALQRTPNSLPLTSALMTVLVKENRYQEGSHLAAKAAQLHPRDLEAQRLYLRVLVLNDDMTKAAPLGRRLLAQAPHDPDFLYLNGIIEREAGQYAAARTHLTESVARNPAYYNSRYNLGVVLAQLKDFKGAKEQLEKALALGAVEPEVHFELATVLRNLGESQQAQEELKVYQQDSKANAQRTLAVGKAGQAALEKDPQQAVVLYREAVEAAPEDTQLLFKLALALDRAGDTAAERTTLEQAIKIDPAFAVAQNQLGYLDSVGGDAVSAEQHFRLALQAAPGYIQAWISLAATLGMESRFPEAQEAVGNALRLDPQNAQALQLHQDLIAAQGQR